MDVNTIIEEVLALPYEQKLILADLLKSLLLSEVEKE